MPPNRVASDLNPSRCFIKRYGERIGLSLRLISLQLKVLCTHTYRVELVRYDGCNLSTRRLAIIIKRQCAVHKFHIRRGSNLYERNPPRHDILRSHTIRDTGGNIQWVIRIRNIPNLQADLMCFLCRQHVQTYRLGDLRIGERRHGNGSKTCCQRLYITVLIYHSNAIGLASPLDLFAEIRSTDHIEGDMIIGFTKTDGDFLIPNHLELRERRKYHHFKRGCFHSGVISRGHTNRVFPFCKTSEIELNLILFVIVYSQDELVKIFLSVVLKVERWYSLVRLQLRVFQLHWECILFSLTEVNHTHIRRETDVVKLVLNRLKLKGNRLSSILAFATKHLNKDLSLNLFLGRKGYLDLTVVNRGSKCDILFLVFLVKVARDLIFEIILANDLLNLTKCFTNEISSLSLINIESGIFETDHRKIGLVYLLCLVFADSPLLNTFESLMRLNRFFLILKIVLYRQLEVCAKISLRRPCDKRTRVVFRTQGRFTKIQRTCTTQFPSPKFLIKRLSALESIRKRSYMRHLPRSQGLIILLTTREHFAHILKLLGIPRRERLIKLFATFEHRLHVACRGRHPTNHRFVVLFAIFKHASEVFYRCYCPAIKQLVKVLATLKHAVHVLHQRDIPLVERAVKDITTIKHVAHVLYRAHIPSRKIAVKTLAALKHKATIFYPLHVRDSRMLREGDRSTIKRMVHRLPCHISPLFHREGHTEFLPFNRNDTFSFDNNLINLPRSNIKGIHFARVGRGNTVLYSELGCLSDIPIRDLHIAPQHRHFNRSSRRCNNTKDQRLSRRHSRNISIVTANLPLLSLECLTSRKRYIRIIEPHGIQDDILNPHNVPRHEGTAIVIARDPAVADANLLHTLKLPNPKVVVEGRSTIEHILHIRDILHAICPCVKG